MTFYHCLILVVLFIQAGLTVAFLVDRHVSGKKALATEPTPIGYKQANFTLNPKQPFRGVYSSARAYGWDGEAESRAGFHSYYSFEQAKSHEQKGNVLLEVFNSGKVEYSRLGAESRHQRVLQIIAHKCHYDERQPTGWAVLPDRTFAFLCDECSKIVRSKSLTDLEAWVNKHSPHPIVVSTAVPTALGGRFVPTVVKDDKTTVQ